MNRSRNAVADPHRRVRIGALVWWTFRDTASPPEELAKCALTMGFPPIFLPVPFPIAPKVAFGRALQRATVKVPVNIPEAWRADRITTLPDVNGPLQEWAKNFGKTDGLEFGILESWAPSDTSTGLPWRPRVWIALDPSKRKLHMFAAADAPDPVVDEMMARTQNMFDKELYFATAPEIGDGVVKALEDAGGVKLRAGLWTVPGEHGISLAKSIRNYLSKVGNSEAGMMILLKSTRSDESGAGSLVVMGLLEEIESLITEIHDTNLKTIGVGALRTLSDRVELMHEKLRTNEELIGRAATKLRAKLEPQRRLLKQAAADKNVSLIRTAGPTAIRHLHDGINAVRNSARKRDLEGLKQAEQQLVSGQAAARTAGIALLLARLRKLTIAAIYVNHELFFKALERASTYVEKQAQIVNPVPAPKTLEKKSNGKSKG